MGIFERVNGAVLDMNAVNLSDDLLTNVNDPQTLESLRSEISKSRTAECVSLHEANER